MSRSTVSARHPFRTLFSTALAGGLLALALPSAPAFAAPDTDPIPLSTIGVGPAAGTLPNGVGWSVNTGTWSSTQGYSFYNPTSPQVWTFNRPVSVRFGIAGLNYPNECITVPVGTVLETLHASHTYDAAARKVCRGIADAGAISTFTHPGPITDLSLIATGAHASAGRGPRFIEVTYDAPNADADTPTTVQDEPVSFEPAENDSAGTGDLVPESVRLLDGGTPVTTLTNSDGTYTVNTSNGEITFTPAPGFVGTATPVEYRVLDTFGGSGTGTITVEVGPIVGVSMFNGPVALGAVGVLALAGGGFVVRRRLIATS